MAISEKSKETFEEFRKSFNYGSRNDLLFKFIGAQSGLTDTETGEFFQGLLRILGESFDTGDYEPVVRYCYHWQLKGYLPADERKFAFQYETSPWSPLTKPLSESRVAIISTGGVFAEGDDPLGPDGPSQEDVIKDIQNFLAGPARLATLPRDLPPERIKIRHPGYDIRGALKDYNVVFPVDRLKEMEKERVIGELASENYSFIGATSQLRLRNEFAPAWAKFLVNKKVDAVLLVAA